MLLHSSTSENVTSSSADLGSTAFKGWFGSSQTLSDRSVLYDYTDIRTGCRVIFHKNDSSIAAFAIDFRTVPDSSDGLFHAAEHMLFRGSQGLLFQSEGGLLAKEPVSVFGRWSSVLESNACTDTDGVCVYATSTSEKDLLVNFLLSLEGAWCGTYPHTGFREEIWRHEQTGTVKRETIREELAKLRGLDDSLKASLLSKLTSSKIPGDISSIQRSVLFSEKEKEVLTGIIYKLREVRLNGIVLNEMLDYYGDPATIMGNAALQSLYPETYYAYDSAGDPHEIPTLTPEKIRNASRFFHPSNCVITLTGDLDPTQFIRSINSYLSLFARRLFPSFKVDLERQREIAQDLEVVIPSIGARGVMQAVAYSARPAKSPHELFTQSFVADFISSGSDLLTIPIAVKSGFREGIYTAEIISDAPLPLLFIGGERHGSLDAVELRARSREAYVDALNVSSLSEILDDFIHSLKLGRFSSSDEVSEHACGLCKAVRRGNDVRFAADLKQQREILEKLGPDSVREILRRDFIDWDHVGTILGRQEKGAEEIWETRQAKIISSHRAHKSRAELASLFYSDVGRVESSKAIRQLAMLIPKEEPDIRIPDLIHEHEQLSHMTADCGEYKAIVTEVHSLRNMTVESLPWIGFLADSYSTLLPSYKTRERHCDILDMDIGLSPGAANDAVPYLYITRGYRTEPNAEELHLNIPDKEEALQYLQRYVDESEDEIRSDPTSIAIDYAWANTLPAGGYYLRLKGLESVWLIAKALEQDEIAALAQVKYAYEYIRTSVPLHRVVCSAKKLDLSRFPLTPIPKIAAPYWPHASIEVATRDLYRDSVTSSVALSSVMPCENAVGRVVARYLSAELLWTEMRRRKGAYSTQAIWDPDWSTLTVAAGQMRTTKTFRSNIVKLSTQLNNLTKKDVFERSRRGAIQQLSSTRPIEDWTCEFCSWQLETPSLTISEQLADLRALTPNDFKGIGKIFERAFEKASEAVVGPEALE